MKTQFCTAFLLAFLLTFVFCVTQTHSQTSPNDSVRAASTAMDSTTSMNPDSTAQAASEATPQTKSAKWRMGLFGAGNVNFHNAQFTNLVGVGNPFVASNASLPSSGALTGGVGIGAAVGLLGEVPMLDWLRVSLRLSYATHNALLQGFHTFAVFDPSSDTFVQKRDNYTLTATLTSLAAEPLVMVTPFASLSNLQLYAGGRVGTMLPTTYNQRTTRQDADFPTGREWNNASGALAMPNVMAALTAGVGYDVPFSLGETVGSLILAPEAFFLLGLTPVASQVEGGSWNMNQVRAGLAVKYEPPEIQQRWEYQEKIDTIRVERVNAEESIALGSWRLTRDTTFAPASRTILESRLRTDTLIVPRATMAGAVKAFGVDVQGVERPVALIRVEEFLANRYLPLLNYVFFDENSSELHERYTRLTQAQVDAFYVPKLYNYEPLRAYQQILNIVGRRMYMYPNAKITLTGCNAFFGSEKGALALSLRRAQAAREYLLNTWKIDSSRITIKARNLSENPSVPITEDDKIVENRRVEVTTDTPEILEWIVTPDTLRVINPPTIRFRLNARADNGIKRWRLTVQQGGTLLRNFGGDGQPPEAITWEFAKEERERGERIVRTDQPLEYTLALTDKKGEVFNTDVDSLPVEQITVQKKRRELRKDKEFEQLSLILFEFDKAQLSDLHKRTAAFVKTRIRPNSEVEILGFTDRTGSPDYNRKLSERRAKQISDLVRHPKTNVRGVGKDELLYTNDLPEGRYYCRTVTVTIETPIETP